MACFGDMNIVWNSSKCLDLLRTTVALGYNAIAINNFVEELPVKTSKKVKGKITDLTPSHEIKLSPDLLNKVMDESKTVIRQYSRFTAVMSELTQCIRLREQVIQDYDILAIQPTTSKVFQEACRTYNIDLVSVDLSQRLDGMLSGKSAHAAVGCAIKRGIHFEIQYSPMIRDSTARRMTIANANLLVEMCRGKNIIVTSGCEKELDLRGPYDVSNLALLFGMSEEQARHAVSSNCHSLLSHAAARKTANGVVNCIKTSSLNRTEQWTIPDSVSDQTTAEPHRKKKKLDLAP